MYVYIFIIYIYFPLFYLIYIILYTHTHTFLPLACPPLYPDCDDTVWRQRAICDCAKDGGAGGEKGPAFSSGFISLVLPTPDSYYSG